jgi:ribosomal protein S18 acetylase RimI-like enzyme
MIAGAPGVNAGRPIAAPDSIELFPRVEDLVDRGGLRPPKEGGRRRTHTVGSLEVDALMSSEIAAAAGVLARSMGDNPNHVAIFGPDREKRVRALERGFAAYFRVAPAQAPLCARLDGIVVGVAGVLPPGHCQLSTMQKLRLLPSMLALPVRDTWRASLVTRAWAARDPEEPHSHLGPMGVDEGLKGRGIGTRLMEAYCRQLDEAHRSAFLETETARNVRFYERFGFEVVDRVDVLDNPNWFMWRSARSNVV